LSVIALFSPPFFAVYFPKRIFFRKQPACFQYMLKAKRGDFARASEAQFIGGDSRKPLPKEGQDP